MLRRCLIGCGILLLLGGTAVAVAVPTPGAWSVAGTGAVLVLALLFEHRSYQRIRDDAPGPDWQNTGETFLDPNTGTRVAVWFQPESGKRAYVRAGGPG